MDLEILNEKLKTKSGSNLSIQCEDINEQLIFLASDITPEGFLSITTDFGIITFKKFGDVSNL